MIHDLPEGQTHSFNDGCGEPAHNLTHTQTTISEGVKSPIDTLTRDICEVPYRAKSEIRRLLTQFAKDVEKATLRDVAEVVEGLKAKPILDRPLSLKNQWYNEALTQTQKEIEKL